MTLRCPTCKKPVTPGSPDMPFCSERCRLIDLGRWSNEEFRIPVVSQDRGVENPADAEDDE